MSDVSEALDSLGTTEAAIVAFNNSLKPGYYTGGSNDTSWTRVISEPQGLPPIPTLGAEATELGYEHAYGLYAVWHAQDAAKVPRNKSGEIYAAAKSGDYSNIRGV